VLEVLAGLRRDYVLRLLEELVVECARTCLEVIWLLQELLLDLSHVALLGQLDHVVRCAFANTLISRLHFELISRLLLALDALLIWIGIRLFRRCPLAMDRA